MAKTLQIEHLLARRPAQLSGGQRQRVAMGRALVRDPKLFLFDEPLSNLDAKLRIEMRTEIKRLHQSLGTTIVYVTHDQIEAMTLATRIAVLKDGVLQQFGTPAEIYDDPANLFVADFMGSPPMNLIPATVEAGGAGPNLRVERVGGAPATLPSGGAKGLEAYAGREAILGIRPEAITEVPADGAADGAAVVACQNRGGGAGRRRHLRDHPSRRQGGGRAHEPRLRGPRGRDPPARVPHGQGGLLRPPRPMTASTTEPFQRSHDGGRAGETAVPAARPGNAVALEPPAGVRVA